MKYFAAAVLACLAWFCTVSLAYSPSYPVQSGGASVPAPSGYGAHRGHSGRGHSKIHRPSKVVHSGSVDQTSVQYGQQTAQHAHGIGGPRLSAPLEHGSAHATLGAAHFDAQQAHERAHASLGAAHFGAQQAHENAHASLGAAHFSAKEAHEDAQASLGAAHFSAQQAHQEAGSTLGAAHHSAQQAHEEAGSTIGDAHYRAQQAHEEAGSTLHAAHFGAQQAQESAHTDVGSAYVTAQQAHESAYASVGEAYASAQDAYSEAQSGLADARESAREAYARAQAAIKELALFASQSRLTLSTSYILNNARFIVSQHFGSSKVKAPRIIVRDAASSGLVCVPATSFNASWIVPGGASSAGVGVGGGLGVSGTGSTATGVSQTHAAEFEHVGGDEVQKAIRPFSTVGQGHGILVSVTGVSSGYGSSGTRVSGVSGHASASMGPSGVALSAGHQVHGAGGHEHAVTVHDETVQQEVYSEQTDVGHSSSDVETFPSSSGLHTGAEGGRGSGIGSGTHPQASRAHTSGEDASSAAESVSTSTGPVGGPSFTAGHASASPEVLSSSAGGAISGGGRVASASRSVYSTESGHGASAGSAHGGSSGGGPSVAASSVDGDGRASLYVSGQHAEAVTAGADGSAVHLSSTGGLSHYGLAECECVPDYLCDEDGLINTSGVGIISVRSFSAGGTAATVDSRCQPGHVCCRHRDRRQPVSWRPLGCGTRSPIRLDRRVVSGEAARLGEFPWMVALRLVSSSGKTHKNKYLCGGSLIAPNVVLTAAHCVYKYRAERLVARVGEWDTNNADTVYPHEDRAVAEVVVHQQFASDSLHYDVALLRLESPVETDAHINTICLPDDGDHHIDFADCYATGWGQESFDNAFYPNLLKKVPLRTVESGRCQTQLRQTRLSKWFELHDTFVCAGGEPNVDTCLGDGGSPLVCRDTSAQYDDEETFVQVGIVAWGINCHQAGVPGVYADVVALMPWIRSALDSLTSRPSY
ncbi:uncharacterized protein LOC122385456 [Amphibalanus amphitrite]|uniref:uncharacterized protein LOC122385456 n=1 Tax=Amphibalanus amphitrite TaxID=1232801 RepID=UPI001C8FB941|nr:uncharacterized protein LOC122385456 [Amphibalanus amphitrite]